MCGTLRCGNNNVVVGLVFRSVSCPHYDSYLADAVYAGGWSAYPVENKGIVAA